MHWEQTFCPLQRGYLLFRDLKYINNNYGKMNIQNVEACPCREVISIESLFSEGPLLEVPQYITATPWNQTQGEVHQYLCLSTFKHSRQSTWYLFESSFMKNENTRTVFKHCHFYKCLRSTFEALLSTFTHQSNNRQRLLLLQDNCLVLLLGTQFKLKFLNI